MGTRTPLAASFSRTAAATAAASARGAWASPSPSGVGFGSSSPSKPLGVDANPRPLVRAVRTRAFRGVHGDDRDGLPGSAPRDGFAAIGHDETFEVALFGRVVRGRGPRRRRRRPRTPRRATDRARGRRRGRRPGRRVCRTRRTNVTGRRRRRRRDRATRRTERRTRVPRRMRRAGRTRRNGLGATGPARAAVARVALETRGGERVVDLARDSRDAVNVPAELARAEVSLVRLDRTTGIVRGFRGDASLLGRLLAARVRRHLTLEP